MKFDRSFDPQTGRAVPVAAHVVRVTAPNASPFTFKGTNSYLVGERSLAVIDPGPDDPSHLEALLAAIDGRPLTHILVTHTHRDHSPLAAALKARTGARTVGEGKHRFTRRPDATEAQALDASADTAFMPDIHIGDGEWLTGDGWSLQAIATPGHTANHLAFGLGEDAIVFCGDHVMGWATTVVAPPDGSMGDYMASLERLSARTGDRLYLPGHGAPIDNPHNFVRALRSHRRQRERAIALRLEKGDETIGEIVSVLYREVDPRLHGAASLTVLAHLEALIAAGTVEASESPPRLTSRFRPCA